MWEIFTIAPDGTELTQITDSPDRPVGRPDWSPDGSKIVFDYDYGSESPRIWVVHSDKIYAKMDKATMLTDNGWLPAVQATDTAWIDLANEEGLILDSKFVRHLGYKGKFLARARRKNDRHRKLSSSKRPPILSRGYDRKGG